MKILSTILLSFSTIFGYGQSDCFYIDSKTNLALSRVDSTLYSGYCNKFFKNGKKESSCFYEKGVIKTSKTWDKNGLLIDSAIYLDGENKYTLYRFFSNKRVEDVGTYIFKSKTKPLLSDSVYEYVLDGKYISYFKNGKIKCENTYRNGAADTLKYFYDNGNLWYIELLKNGKLNDTAKYYYKSGGLNELRIYQEGKLTNPVYEWDNKGNEYEVFYLINNKGEGTVEESRRLKNLKK